MLLTIQIPWKKLDDPIEKARETKKISEMIASELTEILDKCWNLIGEKWPNYSIDRISLSGNTSITKVKIEFSENKNWKDEIKLLKDELLSK